MSEYSEYDVKYLSSSGIKGKLLLYPNKVVFEPKEDNAEEMEIPISKIKDVRFATEKDISALDVFLWGPVIGVLAKRKHKMLTIDFEDEFGIVQHLTFEGYDIEAAVEELYDIRKTRKMGFTATAKPFLKKKLRDGNWQCSRCLRINSPNAKFCTKCGETRRRNPSSWNGVLALSLGVFVAIQETGQTSLDSARDYLLKMWFLDKNGKNGIREMLQHAV